MAFMHTLSLHAVCRLLNALTQGLQAMAAQTVWLRGPGAPNKSGVSGPKSATTSTLVSAAKWAGPLSLVTRTSARPKSTTSWRSVVRPARQTHRGEPTAPAISAILGASSGDPVKATQTSGKAPISRPASAW